MGQRRPLERVGAGGLADLSGPRKSSRAASVTARRGETFPTAGPFDRRVYWRKNRGLPDQESQGMIGRAVRLPSRLTPH